MLIARGFGALTLRAVAAELGATTGLLTHYFPGKRDLVSHALELLEQRSAARPRRTAAAGLPALRSALLDMLPLTEESAETSRIWVSSWDTALADPAWSIDYARKYAQGRERLHALVAAAQRLGELPDADTERLATAVQSFVLGLTVQALIDPSAFPPQRQIELLDGHLAALSA